jgi:hypothetical protein
MDHPTAILSLMLVARVAYSPIVVTECRIPENNVMMPPATLTSMAQDALLHANCRAAPVLRTHGMPLVAMVSRQAVLLVVDVETRKTCLSLQHVLPLMILTAAPAKCVKRMNIRKLPALQHLKPFARRSPQMVSVAPLSPTPTHDVKAFIVVLLVPWTLSAPVVLTCGSIQIVSDGDG